MTDEPRDDMRPENEEQEDVEGHASGLGGPLAEPALGPIGHSDDSDDDVEGHAAGGPLAGPLSDPAL
jgi:hypothetical protein